MASHSLWSFLAEVLAMWTFQRVVLLIVCGSLIWLGAADDFISKDLMDDVSLPLSGDSETTTDDTARELDVSGALTRLIGGLVLIIALVIALAWVLKRLKMQKILQGQHGSHMQVLEQVSIGMKQQVVLLRVGDQALVIGHAEAGLTTLADMPMQSLSAPSQPITKPSAGSTSMAPTPSPAPSDPKRKDSVDAVSGFQDRLQAMLRGKA